MLGGTAYIEARKLLEDMGEKVRWTIDKITIEKMPLSADAKLEMIRKIVE